MKRNKLLLLAGVLCLTSFFTACSDDDGPLYGADELNQDFGSLLDGDALTLTYGGEPLTGKKVAFHTEDSKTATLTLTDVIPGEAETVISNVALTAADDVYHLNGQTTTANGALVKVSGTVSPKNLSVNFDVTMADPKGWAHTYGLGEMVLGDLDYGASRPRPNAVLNSACYCNWDTPIGEGKANTGKAQGSAFRGILGGIIFPQLLNAITLEKDGNVTAGYSADSVKFSMSWMTSMNQDLIEETIIAGRTYQPSPKNLAYWFEKDGKLVLKLNLAGIITQATAGSDSKGMGQMIAGMLPSLMKGLDAAGLKKLLTTVAPDLAASLGSISDATLNQLMGWMVNGIPLHLKTTEGHTHIYLDKTDLDPLFRSAVEGDVSSSDIMKILTLLKPLIPTQYQPALGILQQIPANWPKTTTFELGLDLVTQ